MKIELRVNPILNIRYQAVKGSLDIGKIIQYLDEMKTAQNNDFNMNVCWDLEAAEIDAVQMPDLEKLVRKVADEWRSLNPKKLAIVVSDKWKYGLTRMYQNRLDVEEMSSVQIFATASDALDWLTASDTHS